MAATAHTGIIPAAAADKLNSYPVLSNDSTTFLSGAGTFRSPHPTYTAYTGKPTANASPGPGGSFTVSQVTTNTLGHVTSMTDRTITLPTTANTLTTARKIGGFTFDGSSNIAFYVRCSTAADDPNKVINDFANFTLVVGSIFVVWFTVTNTADAPLTLNINGTGAQPIVTAGNNNIAKAKLTGGAHLFCTNGNKHYWMII